jgi:hypothetical protein
MDSSPGVNQSWLGGARRWVRLAVVLLCGAGQWGCANSTHGYITPERFDFKTVVELPPGNSGGWRAVCIEARFTHGNTGDYSICRFEVGTPLRNRQQGVISLDRARAEAAIQANNAAHAVMAAAQPGDLTGPLCLQFKSVYNELLRQKIKGARVGACETHGVEVVIFDVAVGRLP